MTQTAALEVLRRRVDDIDARIVELLGERARITREIRAEQQARHHDRLAFEWRGAFGEAELETLHALAFGVSATPRAWLARTGMHSLGWVTARAGAELAGFVNVPWDGAEHAWLVDTVVSPAMQRRGIGKQLVATAAREVRAAGCRWLHVDFVDEHRSFYIDHCGFRPTPAGLMGWADAEPV